MPGTAIDTVNRVEEKTVEAPAFKVFIFQLGGRLIINI